MVKSGNKFNRFYFFLIAGILAIGTFILGSYLKTERENQKFSADVKDFVVQDEFSKEFYTAKEAEILIVTGEYKPYVSRDLPGNGVYYQLVAAVLDEMKVNYRIEFYPWNRCLTMVEKGEALATFPYMNTEERKKSFLFTDGLNRNGMKTFQMYYYNRAGSFSDFDGIQISELGDYRIGGISNYFYVELFERYGITLDMSNDEAEVFEKLRNGRIDLVPMDVLVGDYIIDTSYSEERERFGSFSVDFDTAEETYYGLLLSQKNNESYDFVRRFNEAMKVIISNGVYEEIIPETIDE